MDNPQGTLTVTEAELGWLGGMIDGEGTLAFSVYFRRTGMNTIRVKPQVIVCGTDQTVLERVADIIGRLGVGVHFQTSNVSLKQTGLVRPSAKFRPLHVVTVAGFKRATKLLPIISPHLFSVKRRKGELMLQYMTRRLEMTALHGRWATHDAQDLTLMLEIMEFSRVNNAKGPVSKYAGEIERLLRDITQSDHSQPRMVDDVVRTAERSVESQRRGGSAPRVFGGVSRLIAGPK